MKSFWLATLTLTLLTLTGCKQEDPNPELSDPIYRDLERRATEHAKSAEEAKASLPALEEKLVKAEANSVEQKDARREIAKARAKLVDSEQWGHYYRIRSARRKVVDKIEYKRALASDKPWPPPSEYSDYQANRRLVEVSRDWSKRVPKLTSLNPNAPAPKKEAPAGGGHGGGGH